VLTGLCPRGQTHPLWVRGLGYAALMRSSAGLTAITGGRGLSKWRSRENAPD